MRVYGLSYRDLMALPIKVFWNLSGTVERLIAWERKEALELMVAASHNPEQAGELYKALDSVSPQPVKLSVKAVVQATAVRDEEGFNALKQMQG